MATTSLLAQILQRVAAVLAASAPVGTKLFTDRTEPQSREEAPSINLLARAVGRQPHGADWSEREAEIELVFGIRADACTAEAEALHLAVHAPLLADAELLALVDSIQLADETFDREEADSTSLLKKALYRVRYSAPNNTL